MSLILKIAAGVVLGAVVIAAWNAWRQDAADKALITACLAKDQAAAMYALGRTTDADIYACMEIKRNKGIR
jgi:predicted negative regulator of RcsB-dependent stress response